MRPLRAAVAALLAAAAAAAAAEEGPASAGAVNPASTGEVKLAAPSREGVGPSAGALPSAEGAARSTGALPSGGRSGEGPASEGAARSTGALSTAGRSGERPASEGGALPSSGRSGQGPASEGAARSTPAPAPPTAAAAAARPAAAAAPPSGQGASAAGALAVGSKVRLLADLRFKSGKVLPAGTIAEVVQVPGPSGGVAQVSAEGSLFDIAQGQAAPAPAGAGAAGPPPPAPASGAATSAGAAAGTPPAAGDAAAQARLRGAGQPGVLAVGAKVRLLKDLHFKQSGTHLTVGTLATVVAVPGGKEGSVARVQAGQLTFDLYRGWAELVTGGQAPPPPAGSPPAAVATPAPAASATPPPPAPATPPPPTPQPTAAATPVPRTPVPPTPNPPTPPPKTPAPVPATAAPRPADPPPATPAPPEAAPPSGEDAAAPPLPQSAAAGAKKWTVNTRVVKCRSRPRASASYTGDVVRAGQKVAVEKEDGDWVRVSLASSAGGGWVRRKYLTPADDAEGEAAAPPRGGAAAAPTPAPPRGDAPTPTPPQSDPAPPPPDSAAQGAGPPADPFVKGGGVRMLQQVVLRGGTVIPAGATGVVLRVPGDSPENPAQVSVKGRVFNLQPGQGAPAPAPRFVVGGSARILRRITFQSGKEVAEGAVGRVLMVPGAKVEGSPAQVRVKVAKVMSDGRESVAFDLNPGQAEPIEDEAGAAPSTPAPPAGSPQTQPPAGAKEEATPLPPPRSDPDGAAAADGAAASDGALKRAEDGAAKSGGEGKAGGEEGEGEDPAAGGGNAARPDEGGEEGAVKPAPAPPRAEGGADAGALKVPAPPQQQRPVKEKPVMPMGKVAAEYDRSRLPLNPLVIGGVFFVVVLLVTGRVGSWLGLSYSSAAYCGKDPASQLPIPIRIWSIFVLLLWALWVAIDWMCDKLTSLCGALCRKGKGAPAAEPSEPDTSEIAPLQMQSALSNHTDSAPPSIAKSSPAHSGSSARVAKPKVKGLGLGGATKRTPSPSTPTTGSGLQPAPAARAAALASAATAGCAYVALLYYRRKPGQHSSPRHRPATPPALRRARQRNMDELEDRALAAESSVVSSHGAFCMVLPDGAVEAWGDPAKGGDPGGVLEGKRVLAVCPTEDSFVALSPWSDPDGKEGGYEVTVWGYLQSPALPCAANGVTCGSKSFAANLVDGRSVVVWHEAPSAEVLRTQVVELVCTELADAALLQSGEVYIPQGGGPQYGGDPNVVKELKWCGGGAANGSVVRLFANAAAFAAVGRDGAVASWGDPECGGMVQNSSDAALVLALSSRVACVAATQRAFAARHEEGTVAVWGDAQGGGDAGAVQGRLRGVVDVKATTKAFCALRRDGQIACWGSPLFGGDDAEAHSAVAGRLTDSVAATRCAFAAVLRGGSCATWGDPKFGGRLDQKLTRVCAVYATRGAFCALTEAGELHAWGDPRAGGRLEESKRDLIAAEGGAVSVTASQNSFAVLTKKGGVVSWGATSKIISAKAKH
eukprot:TRINITY_DN1678_c1_g1_i3.p1 TRINITY_DN1678_c1_g1~~TRINITY_DN1678_c1_g1_i3.p1  ORF type:complete len:1525 (+),score=426.08 TRINITY_DN1678_c1_g1_i3:88-4575(+)